MVFVKLKKARVYIFETPECKIDRFLTPVRDLLKSNELTVSCFFFAEEIKHHLSKHLHQFS